MKYLEENQTLFKDETVLNYDFLPDKLPGRENETREISLSIKPLNNNRRASNLFIYGAHGIGKTACVKHVLQKVREETPIKTTFINCWENSSPFSILQKIAIDIGIPLPRKGTSKDEVMNVIKSKISQIRGIVVVLDEVDKIESPDILYQLSEFFGNKIALVLITNHREYILNLEERIRSRLGLNHIPFESYSFEQVYEILEERVNYAFAPGSINSKVLEKIASICFENKDIRTGLFLLLNSGRNAEYEDRLILNPKDVERASEKLATSFSLAKEVSLLPEEKFIVECIKNNNGKNSGLVYAYYQKHGGKLSERSYRKYINHLLQLNLIEVKEVTSGTRGRTREIRLKC